MGIDADYLETYKENLIEELEIPLQQQDKFRKTFEESRHMDENDWAFFRYLY